MTNEQFLYTRVAMTKYHTGVATSNGFINLDSVPILLATKGDINDKMEPGSINAYTLRENNENIPVITLGDASNIAY